MTGIVKIDDEVITTDDFIKTIKLTDRFESLIEEMVKGKLAVHAAKKQGISVSVDEIQARADQFRRVHGLHRAKETNDYLDAMRIELEEFENFIRDTLYYETMMAQVCNDEAVHDYFRMNSPKFESIEISHIVVDSEGKARELMSILGEAPEMFKDMAREHSVAETRKQGGRIGKVMRASLQASVEAKVFNAREGDLLGPFATGDGSHFEIFRIDARNPARLDEETTNEIRTRLKDEWLAARAREHRVEAL